ncbi:MAG: type II toxin-antitoxin system VapC family toxin [Acidobacteriota bacterium]|nr:type II toxin-antitoxin system VapC family toxin [Acidobacteriota bacterium]
MLFPDINVWVALTYEGHVHHSNAAEWFATLSRDATLAFCRFTQLGVLRLLTAEAVMSDEVMTQPQAWLAYDRWLQDPRAELVDEPAEIETRFRALTRLRQPATRDWADSYLVAFATVGQLTLVTFDRGLRAKAKSAILLG